MFEKVNPRENFPELEKEILKFWKENKIFEKSVNNGSLDKTFSFYDGPPFATGLPHYGHLLAGTIKDVIPRYKTMQGFKVERIWGWDTHGLPIENIVEQELDIKTKLQVEEYGIDKFNEKCREKVLRYAEEWEKIVERTGRWVDMENAYLTMSPQFMESVWWVFKTLHENGLIYEGHKVMPYCPRCATPLSNFEVGLGYIDKRDKTATVKFQDASDKDLFYLAWTTTPWTLPGNLALTVGPKIVYVEIKCGDKRYILAKERLDNYQEELGKHKIIKEYQGKDLVGRKYVPVFNYYQNPKKAFEIISGDFVSTEDGTGIVHTAPAFGEDDYEVAKKHGIDFFMPVNDLGQFTIEVSDYAGRSVVEFNTNDQIIKDLGNKILKVEEITHSYPHCWRCDTPLIYKGVSSWFVAVNKVKAKMLQLNKKIYWLPDSIGHGRFQKLIENAPDWSISRNRFWGTPLPVWYCNECKDDQIIGSIKELEEKSGEKIEDVHLHKIKSIKLPCACGGEAELSGEVLDCWFESGSMPYASIHYPFENKKKFDKDFPADFIAEGIDQTRGWFYSLLVLSTALKGVSSYESVVVNGTVLAENGQKMAKKLRNYPDPIEIVEKYGADAMRFYIMASPAVKAEDFRFSEKGTDEIVKKVLLTLWNSYSFFITYATLDKFEPTGDISADNVLDKWILSKTNDLIKKATEALDKYDISQAARTLGEFIDDLSNWYIRRSRKRFWRSENDSDKNNAYETLYYVLVTYVKLLAPFMPFATEAIYQNLRGKKEPESIHLCNWPEYQKALSHQELEEKMLMIRKAIELGLSQRAEKGIKVRQPLQRMTIKMPLEPKENLVSVISEEVNVKEILYQKSDIVAVELETEISPELEKEGIARELVRTVQSLRKKAGFEVENRIELYFETNDSLLEEAIIEFTDKADYSIKRETLAEEISKGKKEVEFEEEPSINGRKIWIGLKRI